MQDGQGPFVPWSKEETPFALVINSENVYSFSTVVQEVLPYLPLLI